MGGRFRAYSLATMAIVAVAGIATFLYVPMIYGYLLLIATLAVALTRADRDGPDSVRIE